MSMKTNEMIATVAKAIAVVFLIFIVQGLLVGIGKSVKNFQFKWPTLFTYGGGGVDNGTTESSCSDAVNRAFLVKTGRLAGNGMPLEYGEIQGMVYDQLVCQGARVVSADTAMVTVGLFPVIPAGQLTGGRYIGSEPFATTLCDPAAGNPCYQFTNVAPGVYSVLADRGNGWYCDRGQCRVTVGGGFIQIFDINLH